jgi:hypothetical protein
MKTTGIINGIVFAILVSLTAGVANVLLTGLVTKITLFNLLLNATTLAYLIYLLTHSSARAGRVAAISVWAVASLVCWLLEVPLIDQVYIQVGIIWLVRSLYFHASIFAAMLDFGVISVGLAASAWAMVNTGSLAIAVWSFYLTQSLFCSIPDFARTESSDVNAPQSGSASFQSAHRVALDAVRKLTQP